MKGGNIYRKTRPVSPWKKKGAGDVSETRTERRAEKQARDGNESRSLGLCIHRPGGTHIAQDLSLGQEYPENWLSWPFSILSQAGFL